MAVTITDIRYRYSGGASNADKNLSLGGVMSSSGPATGVNENLFDNVSSGEATTGDTEYRCIYVYNANAADTINGCVVWLADNTPSPDSSVQIGLDPAGNGNGSTTGVATTIANEGTAPAGVTFTDAPNVGSGLTIGTLAPLTGRAVWFKRVIAAGAASFADDGCRLSFKGTPA